MPQRTIPVGKIPPEFYEEVVAKLAASSIGFVRIEDTPVGEQVDLLGSGTCITDGTTHAILTAEHVLNVLPKHGRLGLLISATPQPTSVDVRLLEYRPIARGKIDSEGPDLGLVILTSAIVGSIAARKTFYNINARRDRMLQNPPDIEDGVWVVNGFVEERTTTERSEDGRLLIKGFYNMTGAGGPDDPPNIVGEYDYLFFPVSYSGRAIAPSSFGGMSGGGLWQIPFREVQPGGVFSPIEYLLSGVVFYQEPTTDDRCGVKCHARVSIYKAVSEALKQSPP